MGDKSSIEWTEATWNPIVGCSKVSPGCAHCYAEELHRTRLSGKGAYPEFRPWTPQNANHNVTLVPERLDQPLRWRKPRMIFVNSMSDLFHENVPFFYIDRVYDVMKAAERHTFQVLTKRPERAREYYRKRASITGRIREWSPGSLPNVWLGTSIENARWIGRADALRETRAAVRFISAEPLLGPLVLGPARAGFERQELDLTGIDWLIVGGESGARRRPPREAWVRDLRDAALATPCPQDAHCGQQEHHTTAFFFKQWGGRTPKAGGRELDGRTWDEMPSVRPVSEVPSAAHVA